MSTDTTQLSTLSRRRLLVAMGAVGGASAGAGLGTAALLGDVETLAGRLEAGRLDLRASYRSTYRPSGGVPTDAAGRPYPVAGPSGGIDGLSTYLVGQGPDLRHGDGSVLDDDAWTTATAALDACRSPDAQLPLTVDGRSVVAGDGSRDGSEPGWLDGDAAASVVLGDVKPLDEGLLRVGLHLCGNPVVLWYRVEVTDDEGGVLGPESVEGVDDDASAGELDDYLWVEAWCDADGDGLLDGDETVLYRGSLAGWNAVAGDGRRLLSEASGASGDERCFDPARAYHLAVRWVLPAADDLDALPSDLEGTLGGELRAKGLPNRTHRALNAVQTDRVTLTLTVSAVQCRARPVTTNPFAGTGGSA